MVTYEVGLSKRRCFILSTSGETTPDPVGALDWADWADVTLHKWQ